MTRSKHSGFKNWREERFFTNVPINDCMVSTRVSSADLAVVCRWLEVEGGLEPKPGISGVIRAALRTMAKNLPQYQIFEGVDDARAYLEDITGGANLNQAGKNRQSAMLARHKEAMQRGDIDPAYFPMKTLTEIRSKEDIPKEVQEAILKAREDFEAGRLRPIPTPEQMTGPQPGQPGGSGGSGDAVYDMTALKNTFADPTAAPLTQPQGAASDAANGAANELNEEDESNGN